MKTCCHLKLLCGMALLPFGPGAVAQASNSDEQPVNFSSFKIISERNIFDPNRSPRNVAPKPRQTPAPVRPNTFSLAGTMSYEEGTKAGTYAFFSGSSVAYRKTLQEGGAIADFKVTAITSDSVTLTFDTNRIVLNVGMQLRDDGQGHWSLVPEPAAMASNSSGRGFSRNNANSTPENTRSEADSANSAPVNDTLQRLMELRAQEEQQSGNRD